MSPTRKPFSPLLIWSSVLALSALMAATVFSSMALASAAVPCANAVVENKTAMAPSAPITSLRNMDIPPCSSSNLQFMAVDTLPNVALTCDPRPFTAAIVATAIPAAMRPYLMRTPLAAAVRALQHCAVETDERGGCNGLLYLSIGRTSGFCRFSESVNAICTGNLCCHSEANELLGFPVQSSRGIHQGPVFVP